MVAEAVVPSLPVRDTLPATFMNCPSVDWDESAQFGDPVVTILGGFAAPRSLTQTIAGLGRVRLRKGEDD